MEVICIEEKAFYTLLDMVFEHIESRTEKVGSSQWIDAEEVMQLLRIKSKTTLQKLRDEGQIRFSQPKKKIILYDRDSIYEFLERHAREIF